MIEVLHCIGVNADLLDDPDILDGELLAQGLRRQGGIGAIKAPRGTLIHSPCGRPRPLMRRWSEDLLPSARPTVEASASAEISDFHEIGDCSASG